MFHCFMHSLKYKTYMIMQLFLLSLLATLIVDLWIDFCSDCKLLFYVFGTSHLHHSNTDFLFLYLPFVNSCIYFSAQHVS